MCQVDYMGIMYNAYAKCQSAEAKLGSPILLLDLESQLRKLEVSLQKYQDYLNAKSAGDSQAEEITKDWCQSVSGRLPPYVVCNFSHVEVYNLYWPDILYIMYIEVFDHLLIWINSPKQWHGKAMVYDKIWAGIPPYPKFYHYGKAN